MYIQSRDNQKVKEYIKLRDKRAYRETEKKFVLEGARIVGDALKENAPIISGFYTSEAKERFSETASKLIERLGENAHEISEEVSEKLAGTVMPQGIFAVSSTLDKIHELDKIVYGRKFLILNSLQDPGNIGTVLRAADAVGVDGVFLCGCCDIYNPKVVRSTMGSLFRVPFETKLDYPEVVSRLKSGGASVYASVVDPEAESLRKFRFPEKSAVVIGNEGSGLSKQDADICDGKITIKMSGTVESLNAAAAAAIFLWELTRNS